MAETTAALLAESGLAPRLSDRATPTPVMTHALVSQRAAAGLVLTASHNPAIDHGLKVFGPDGSSILEAVTTKIERIAMARMHDDEPSHAAAPTPRCDFVTPYLSTLQNLLDDDAFARSDLRVVYDAMHGSGAGVLDVLLEAAGAKLERLRVEPDPTFGGAAPDPTPDRLGLLCAEIRKSPGLGIGLATDGDADRFGVVDGAGRVLTETQVLALLVDHLASTGRIENGVALGAGTGSLVDKVAAAHGLPVERFPIGFRHLSAAMRSGDADVAGEESGGFALASVGPDKDGILAGCLLANLVATTGQPIEVHLERLETRFGASACGRRAVRRTDRCDSALEAVEHDPPRRFAGVDVVETQTEHALRLVLADDGFVMFRRSGTENAIRIYAEASTPHRLEARLNQAESLLDSGRADR